MSIQVTRTGGASTDGQDAAVHRLPIFFDSAGKQAVALACAASRPQPPPPPSTPSARGYSDQQHYGGDNQGHLVTNRARVYLVDGLSSDILILLDFRPLRPAPPRCIPAGDAQDQLCLRLDRLRVRAARLQPLRVHGGDERHFLRVERAAASACPNTVLAPPFCLTLKLNANNVTVNQFGDNAVAKVNVRTLTAGGAFGRRRTPPRPRASLAASGSPWRGAASRR